MSTLDRPLDSLHPLSMPVAALVRESTYLEPGDSLMRAADVLRDSTFSMIPVIQMGQFLGVVSESSLAQAYAEGKSIHEPCIHATIRQFPTVPGHFTGQEALQFFQQFGLHEALVMDADNFPVGLLSPSDLFEGVRQENRPALVGGMATPFGVYLTNGNIRAGVKDWAVVATGAFMFTLFLGAVLISYPIVDWLATFKSIPLSVLTFLFNAIPTVLFLVSLRLVPLSGIHAAEHKVVHAIERGEPLTLEVVKRMPRVHPRCGTNIAVGASLFMGIWGASAAIPSEEIRLLLGILVALFFWRPIGNVVQWLVTTKPPTDKQILMGISSAKDLLHKYQMDRRLPTNPFRRILASGMLHVIAGSMICYGVVELVLWIFKIDMRL